VLFLAADLIWATRIKATAEDLGVAARPVRTMEMLEARLADTNATSLLLDLEKPAEALSMITRLRSAAATPRERAIRIIVWGPHVARDLLQQARDLGADEVLTRGAFDHHLPEILLKLGSGATR
jgi:CheY-like chemotaxis protein